VYVEEDKATSFPCCDVCRGLRLLVNDPPLRTPGQPPMGRAGESTLADAVEQFVVGSRENQWISKTAKHDAAVASELTAFLGDL